MNVFLLNALQQYSYVALWLIVFVAAAGVPLSISLLLFAAGAFSALGDFNIILLFLVVLSASVMGDNLGYVLGRCLGVVLLAWLERQKRFRWMTLPTLVQGRAYFRQRGGWAIFMTRFLLSALGGSINLLAGLEQYPYCSFLFWDVCGEILGAITPLGLGYVFVENWEEVAGLFGAFSGLFLALLVTIAILVLLMRKIHQHRSASIVKAKANTPFPGLASNAQHEIVPLLIPE